MRHRKAGTKLNRTASHRKAMMRNVVTSLFEHGQIVTTETKAKAVKPLAEKIITIAKKGDLHARRQALAILTKKSVAHTLFTEIKDRYMERSGGYTSIVKIGPRRGDAAEMAVLRLVKEEEDKPKKKAKKKKAVAKKKTAEPKAAKKKAAPAPAPAVEEPKDQAVAVEPEAAPVETAQPVAETTVEVEDEAKESTEESSKE